MVNSDDFIKRLEVLFDYYGETSSSFADKIGVQRSSLSHLLSGRNKPSLDFILKLIDVFPEVDLYWITNGKGSFPKNATIKSEVPATLFSQNEEEKINYSKREANTEVKNDWVAEKNLSDKVTEKIVVFYTDGTFKEYKPD